MMDDNKTTMNAFKMTLIDDQMPEDLDKRIMLRVTAVAARVRTRRMAGGIAASGACVVAFVAAGYETLHLTYVSGFGQYASLLFTDGGAALADWRDLVWTLIESVPVWSVALLLGTAALGLFAARFAAGWKSQRYAI